MEEYTAQNSDLGLRATVVKNSMGGFSVILLDTDADETLNTVQLFSNLPAAIAFADAFVSD
jgi:hypothetical protein